MAAKRKVYSYKCANYVNGKFPLEIHEMLGKYGWDVLGVYEKVHNALREFKRAKGVER